MKVVGITGGIGSGKTTASEIFEVLGVPLYSADDRAKAVYTESLGVRAAVEKLFGKSVYTEQGLDRQALASIVFKDQAKLEQLNAIVHPAVQADFEHWLSEQGGAPYVLKEAAILIEAGTYASCDAVVLVSAPIDVRVERVMQRDQSSRDEVEARMSKQWTDEQKRPFADFEIVNDGERSLILQVRAIHEQLVDRFSSGPDR